MIVGLTGPARCGKNTIADHLVADHGFTRIAFSDALYKEVAEAFDVPEARLRNEETKDASMFGFALRWCRDDQFVLAVCRAFNLVVEDVGDAPRSPREILQWWGTEYRRAQDPDYWVKKLAEQMCKITGADDHDILTARVAVDGVRFPNEETFLRGLPGFEMWHVARRDAPQVAGHVSEVEQKRITVDVERDAVIQNNGTVPQLWTIVDRLLEERL